MIIKLDVSSGFIGNDIIFMPDFQKSLSEPFKKKVYTENELQYCESFSEPILRYASTFAAKEAVYKAVKQYNSDKSLSWKSIEINRDKPAGKPTVILQNYPEIKISLSITHDGEYIWAIAFLSNELLFI